MKLLLCLLFCGTPPTLLEKAINANGPWEQVHTFYYSQDFTGHNPWQNYSFSHPLPLLDKGEYYMDVEKGMYHNHTTSYYPGGYKFDLVTIGKDSATYFYDKGYDRYGKTVTKSGSENYMNKMTDIHAAFPYYILKELATTKDPLTFTDSSIQRTGSNGILQHYIFDTATYLLKRIETGTEKRLFEQYEKREGVLVPRLIYFYGEKDFRSIEMLKEFKTNIPVASSVFEVPPQYLVTNEIAKDVFLIEKIGGSRNVIFINMKDHIVVTEAPLSDEICQPIIDIIHKTLPGKPIRYVHLSHHHSDHIDGVNAFVREGATIICAEPVEKAVRTITKGTIKTFRSKLVLEDASHRVELLEVPNSHAEGMSILYLPKEGFVFEGDLLSIPEDGTITAPITTTKEFAAYMAQHKITFKRIIAFHNKSDITLPMFQQMMQ